MPSGFLTDWYGMIMCLGEGARWMARPREFDETEVLEAALELFRAKGFEGTTLAELEQATGLGRASLYGAFGDKRSLFLKVLGGLGGASAAGRPRRPGRYCETAMECRLEGLRAPGAGRAAILAVFREIARAASTDRDRKGCMVTNCAVELADRDAVEIPGTLGPDARRAVGIDLDVVHRDGRHRDDDRPQDQRGGRQRGRHRRAR